MNRSRVWIVSAAVALVMSGTAFAGVVFVESPNISGNAAALADWYTAVGIDEAQVEFFVDFESIPPGTNLHDVADVLPGSLVIRDTGTGTPAAYVRDSSSYFGGSSPIDTRAVAHDEQAYLVLDFSDRPIDYLALYDIDHTGTQVVVHFVGGGTATTDLDGTATSGSSAEFFGLFRNDQPQITMVELDSSGDGEWGVDNLRYGVVPEPATLSLLGVGFLGLLGRRRMRRR